MKKVLIITYEMIPYTKYWGASQRVYYYANFLTEHGFSVDVLASRNTNIENEVKKTIKFNTLHLKNNYQKKDEIKEPINSKTSTLKYVKARIISFLKYILKNLDSIFNNDPNLGMGFIAANWIRKNNEKILTHIEKYSIENVIISAPPFGLLRPKLLKKIKNQIPGKLIIDYRDPWNCWNNKGGISFLREKKIINLCDFAVTTNNNHRQRLIKDFDIDSNKVITVMNGYDDELWNTVEKEYPINTKNEKLTFSYIGSISFKNNSYRNPTNLLEAYSSFPENKKTKLRFIGLDLTPEKLDELSTKYPNVDFIPMVSQEDSFKYMLQSDVLINMHTTKDLSSKFLIGGKLFDYYRSKRFILSINSAESFEHEFVNEKKIGMCIENNNNEILNAINLIYQKWESNGNLINKLEDEELSLYSRKYFNNKLLQLLH